MNTEATVAATRQKVKALEAPVIVTASRALAVEDNGKVLDVQKITGSSASTTSKIFSSFDFSGGAGSDLDITIAGKAVALSTNLVNEAGMIAAVQAAMDAGGVTHVVTGSGTGRIIVTAIAHTTGSIAVAGTDAALWTTGGSSVAGVSDSAPTITIPGGKLPVGFACRFVAPLGVNMSVDPLDSVTLNGGSSTLTRARASNPCFVKFVMRGVDVALLSGS